MRHRMFMFEIVSCCIAIQAMNACAQSVFSNLGQTPVGSLAIANNSWRAERFYSGPNTGGYTLNSIQIQLGTPTGTPSGFSLGIYDSNGFGGNTPGNLLQSLVGPEPSGSGVLTYQSPSFLLGPNSAYFIVATAAKPLASGSFQWDITSWVDQAHVFDFGAGGLLFQSSDGNTWTYSRPNNFVFAVNATVVPEPSICALASVCCCGFLLSMRRSRKSKA
jgi:hypothetical protein